MAALSIWAPTAAQQKQVNHNSPNLADAETEQKNYVKEKAEIAAEIKGIYDAWVLEVGGGAVIEAIREKIG